MQADASEVPPDMKCAISRVSDNVCPTAKVMGFGWRELFYTPSSQGQGHKNTIKLLAANQRLTWGTALSLMGRA